MPGTAAYCLMQELIGWLVTPVVVPDERGNNPNEQQTEHDLRTAGPGASVAGHSQQVQAYL